ncbi:hypothetical protein [Jatrophihabitans sp.]|uniref:DUF6912 family protein n=1 Tax=Jatrophihabitans sp. TaxID=1932789 RepID=UPI0030C6C19C|nr:hypothetical protein [Jatrophihabitans sp.]
MRIYLPGTSATLRTLFDSAQVDDPKTGFAVTPGLREWYRDDDIEELEYAAMTEAARASLRLIEADPEAARRRVVIAVDAAEGDVTVRDDLDRGVVRLTRPIALAFVASIHVDDETAAPVVEAAAAAITAADLGDPQAQERVDDAEGNELSWYANQELPELLQQF